MGTSNSIQAVFATFSSIADQALFLTDLVEFLQVVPKTSSRPNALAAPRPIRDGFVFEDVTFSYPGNGRLVLDRLNLRLTRGERVALIGENGQGKTTIVKLLTRLYDPTSGRILLDGADLRDYSIEDLQSQIGVIFQDFMRYEMTARENIAFGRIEAAQNGAVSEAARKSLADKVIERLPKTYEQLLGLRFEGGVDLSGGEWQKIALARAYFRDAQLVILDEPTAALDARSEHEVFERFAELTEDKTALLISHRFSTVRMADRIVVLENGKIAEEGNHDDLIAREGRYATMFDASVELSLTTKAASGHLRRSNTDPDPKARANERGRLVRFAPGASVQDQDFARETMVILATDLDCAAWGVGAIFEFWV